MNLGVEKSYLEIERVGAGMGEGFTNTNELKAMTYQDTINGQTYNSRKEDIVSEHDGIRKNEVFGTGDKDNRPHGSEPMDRTWACKLKSSVSKRGRLNACGFTQIDIHSYDSANMHIPMTNAVTVRLRLVMILMV